MIPCQFEDAFEFCGGLARVYQEGKYGYVLEDGTISIPIEYDDAYDFGEGVAAVCENGAWKYIDTSGTVVIDLGLEAALPASNGKAWAKLDGEMGHFGHRGSGKQQPSKRMENGEKGACSSPFHYLYGFVALLWTGTEQRFASPFCRIPFVERVGVF